MHKTGYGGRVYFINGQFVSFLKSFNGF